MPGALPNNLEAGIILDDMMAEADCLQLSAYFSGLDSEEIDSIREHMFKKSVARGEVITFEGEPATAIYIVISGVVKVFKTSTDGKEQIIYLARPGDSFNDVPVFGGGLNLASAEAIMQVNLCGIKKDELKAILQGNPKLAENVLKVLSQRVEQMVSLVEDLSFRRVTGRVAKILLENAEDTNGQRHRLTQQEMAAMAGTAREMIGRSLKLLEDEGKVRLERNRIVITDKKALGEIAGVST
ncbi:MAG: cyclic nucleotide-binding domain-containing protein [Dehalococcoidia bacterium]|nr:cyclic nucleotide-binding domain-containing protein [Dehalococcoidia bacterium]